MTDPRGEAHSASPDDWYEREKAAFISWWESEGQDKFSDTPTLAAGAGWLARAEVASSKCEAHEPFSRQELDATLADLKQMWGALADLAMSVPGAKEVLGPRKDLPKTIDMIFAQASINASPQSDPVAWRCRGRATAQHEWEEWRVSSHKPQGPTSARFQMEPLYASLLSASGHRATAEKCAELVENEDCDQTEYTCGTITRCAKAIRAFAATLPEAPQPATPRSEPTDTDPQGSKRLFLGPTPEMIEAGAQRLVRVETGEEKWPDAWSKMDVRAARNDAERCWLSMWLAAPSFVSEKRAILDPSVYDETDQYRQRVVPDGWKLVPVEATSEMLDAGGYRHEAYQMWRAMLAAAPSPDGNDNETGGAR
jgi:hypothetical protein